MVKLEKLEGVLARAAPPDEDVDLADLLSLPASERYPLSHISPQRKNDRTLEALLRQLEGLARQQPVTQHPHQRSSCDVNNMRLMEVKTSA